MVDNDNFDKVIVPILKLRKYHYKNVENGESLDSFKEWLIDAIDRSTVGDLFERFVYKKNNLKQGGGK